MFLDKRKGPTLPVRQGGGAIGQGEGPYTCLFAGMYSIMARSHRWELWGNHFRDVGKFSWTTPHAALMILLPFSNWGQICPRLAQLMTYGLLVTLMNMTEQESFTQYKRINHHITFFTRDWRCNRLLASTLLSFKRCVLVNQLRIRACVAFHTVAIRCASLK